MPSADPKDAFFASIAKLRTCSTLTRRAALVGPYHQYVRRRLKVKPIKASTRIRAEGKLREVEGALKEIVGAAALDRDLEAEGKHEKRVGKAQGVVGRVAKALGR
jgi:uncharacterized protein YjbJ (UPF0337 family)